MINGFNSTLRALWDLSSFSRQQKKKILSDITFSDYFRSYDFGSTEFIMVIIIHNNKIFPRERSSRYSC